MRARDNPFRAERLAELPYRLPAPWTWAALLERFDELGRRAALVGPEGHGKTTLLEELGERLEERGWRVRRATVLRPERRLSAAQKSDLFADLTERHVLLVDGAGALGPLAGRALRHRARRAGGLIVTRHRPGPLPTLLRCETTPRLLAEIVEELAPGLALPPGLAPEALFHRHRGNLRAALGELYDACAAR